MSTPSNSRPNASQFPNWHIRLRQILEAYFDENDIETLCFDLRFDYESLTGEGKTRKIVELIKSFVRLGRIEELIDYCSRQRPNIPWAELREAAVRNPLAIASEPDEAGSSGTRHHPENVSLERSRSRSSSRLNVWYIIAFGVVATGLVGLTCLIVAVFVPKVSILFPAAETPMAPPATSLPNTKAPPPTTPSPTTPPPPARSPTTLPPTGPSPTTPSPTVPPLITQVPPGDIPFVYDNGFVSGLTIHRVWAKNTGTDVEFQIDYTSDINRGMSFFDPPKGEIISVQKDLPAGTHSVLVAASITALQRVSDITVKFYNSGLERNFIFLDFQAIRNILQSTVPPLITQVPPGDIPFVYDNGFVSGLTIHRVWAKNTGTDVEFQIDYTSDINRGMSFFDPPKGEIISVQKDLPAGTHSVLVAASITALQRVSDITVSFYDSGSEPSFIFLDFQAIRNILP